MESSLVAVNLSELPGVVREALRSALAQSTVVLTVRTVGGPVALALEADAPAESGERLHRLDEQDLNEELVRLSQFVARELYARSDTAAVSVALPIVHMCRGRDQCEVCQSATDDEIRKLRGEARAVADWDTSRACCAALGLPTMDGALGLVDGIAARARVTARIRGQRYPLHEREYRAPRLDRGDVSRAAGDAVNVDPIVLAFCNLHDRSDLWEDTRRDPDAFREAVRFGLARVIANIEAGPAKHAVDNTDQGGERAHSAGKETPLAVGGESDGDPARSSANAGEPNILPGRFYATDREGVVPVEVEAPAAGPDLWICRRVADYPDREVPVGGAVACCDRCIAAVVYNPDRDITAPKRCMQCAGIEPLPMERAS